MSTQCVEEKFINMNSKMVAAAHPFLADVAPALDNGSLTDLVDRHLGKLHLSEDPAGGGVVHQDFSKSCTSCPVAALQILLQL